MASRGKGRGPGGVGRGWGRRGGKRKGRGKRKGWPGIAGQGQLAAIGMNSDEAHLARGCGDWVVGRGWWVRVVGVSEGLSTIHLSVKARGCWHGLMARRLSPAPAHLSEKSKSPRKVGPCGGRAGRAGEAQPQVTAVHRFGTKLLCCPFFKIA